MSINPAVEGRVYRMPGTHLVSEQEIAAFRAAVGAPGLSQTASATFAVTVAQRAEAEFMKDPDAGVDYSRLVHGEEAFVHEALIEAGDELVAETTVTRVRTVGGHAMITLSTTVETVGGQARCTATSMVVIREEQTV